MKKDCESAIEMLAGGQIVAGKIPQAAIDEVVAQFRRDQERELWRREFWGDAGPESMTRLCGLFPSLRGVPGTRPWNAIELLEWLCGPAPGSGAHWAGLFVLGVWNPGTDWREEAQQLPARPCHVCAGVGRLERETGNPVRRATGNTVGRGEYLRPEYDDDHDQVLRYVPVETSQCDMCHGKGEYVPGLQTGRFDVFSAMQCWDRSHVSAFLRWVELPFWS